MTDNPFRKYIQFISQRRELPKIEAVIDANEHYLGLSWHDRDRASERITALEQEVRKLKSVIHEMVTKDER